MDSKDLDARIEREQDTSLELAYYLSSLVDGTSLHCLTQARDTLLSNYALMTEVRKALSSQDRGKS